MKKVISVILMISVIAGIFAMCGMTAFAEDDVLSYLTYKIVDEKVTITDCDESISGEVVIPETIGGYQVTKIATVAFENCTLLKKVVVPDNISFGYHAFKNCTSLTEAEIGSTDAISTSLFGGCVNLETVKINTKVLSSGLFYGCVNLKTVEIGNTVERIESGVFDYCSTLEEIYIPESVVEIQVQAFNACANLKKIVVNENNSVYSSENGMLFNKDKTKLVYIPLGLDASIKIPESVMVLGECACYTFIDAEIDLTGIEVIETAAVAYCFNQETLVIPESVAQINPMAFLALAFLKEVYIYNPDVELGEMCLGYNDFDVLVDKDTFIEIAKKAFFIPDDDERNFWWDRYEESVEYKDDLFPQDGLTIYGYEGSTAEIYAMGSGFEFVAICKHNYLETVITAPTYSQSGEGGMVCEHCGDVQSVYELPVLEIENSEVKVDKDTDISIVFPEGTFEAEAEIEVKPVSEGDAFKLISHKQGNYKVTMFDINVTVDGQKVQPNGTVLVKIPLPKGYNQNKCVVYYVSEDGTMEELKTYQKKDGYVYFETDHFSYYAITEEISDADIGTDEECSFMDKIKECFKKIVEFFRKLFGMFGNTESDCPLF